ncbi:MAG: TatD family hydrolase [Bacteroidetes bacterium]|nr:TatD family hydrolase [Bacteroidota bacterium]
MTLRFTLSNLVFTDTHAHLYLEEFDADRDQMMQRVEQAGVNNLFLPNIDSSSVEQLLSICSTWPHLCYPMMGLHPTSVRNNYAEELKLVRQYLSDKSLRFYGVGEIGIDLYWDKTFEKEQTSAFNLQLDLALEYRLPVAIHTRNSMKETLEIMEARNDRGLKGVFHCYSGDVAQAERVLMMGFYLGIGGVVTYKKSVLADVVAAIPLESLLLETDAPFLPPVPKRGQRNEPAYIPLIAKKIAEIKGVSLEEVAEVTTKNALNLFTNYELRVTS